MRGLWRRFMGDESGATAIEYGLIVSLIVIAIIAVLLTLGPQLATLYQKVSDGFGP